MPTTPNSPWHALTEVFHKATSKGQRMIGLEVERMGLWEDGHTLQYSPAKDRGGRMRPGASDLLQALKARYGWEAIANTKGQLLGFSSPTGKVSLEPGSQLEFSCDPRLSVGEVAKTVGEFESKVSEITRPWDLRWVGLAVNPFHVADEIELIPSERYAIMTKYLPTRGSLATSMMRLTTSVQINLDYSSEAEAVEMLRVALLLGPISYALFANSPIFRKAESGLLSYRGAIWRKTDPDRTGLIPTAFSEGFNFDRYAELLWKTPLMFAEDENHNYVATDGLSLSDLAQGKKKGVNASDNLLNGVREFFPEARLKPGYVEIRSIDGLKPADRYAATAFWAGILYCADARRFALELTRPLVNGLREQALVAAIHAGLKAKVGKIVLSEVAQELIGAAREGLRQRGLGEEKWLEPAEEIVESGENPAEKTLQLFQGPWNRSLEDLVRYSGEDT